MGSLWSFKWFLVACFGENMIENDWSAHILFLCIQIPHKLYFILKNNRYETLKKIEIT